jgi:hypothetical protein
VERRPELLRLLATKQRRTSEHDPCCSFSSRSLRKVHDYGDGNDAERDAWHYELYSFIQPLPGTGDKI